MHGEAGLEPQAQLPQGGVPVRGEPRHLEEEGLRAPPHGAEDLAHHLSPSEEDGADAEPLPFPPQEVLKLLEPARLLLGHEEVAHEEAGVMGQARVQARLFQEERP